MKEGQESWDVPIEENVQEEQPEVDKEKTLSKVGKFFRTTSLAALAGLAAIGASENADAQDQSFEDSRTKTVEKSEVNIVDGAKTALKEVLKDASGDTAKYKVFIDIVKNFSVDSSLELDEKKFGEIASQAKIIKEFLKFFSDSIKSDMERQADAVNRNNKRAEEAEDPVYRDAHKLQALNFKHNQRIDEYWLKEALNLSASMDALINRSNSR